MKNNNTNTMETGRIPFPAHVRTPAPNQDTIPLSRDMIETSRDVNNIFQSAGNVHKFVRAHYVNMENGVYGIERLIADILTKNGAVFPKGIEQTEYRSVAVASAMYASDIYAIVKEVFGDERYPFATVHSYLSFFMAKRNSVNKTGRIQLTNAEDSARSCCKPRTKYYLLEGE